MTVRHFDHRLRCARTMRRAGLLAVCAFLLWSAGAAGHARAQPNDCTVTLSPSQSIGTAVRDAARGDRICLLSGEYGPFDVGPTVATDVEVRGLGEARIIAIDGPGVAIDGAVRFTLSGLVIAGGDPAGVSVREVDGLLLRGILISDALIALLIDDSRAVTVENVTLADVSDAGLVARRSTVEATGVTIRDATYGVAAIDGGSLLLRDSTIDGGAGPAILAGGAGCADVPIATRDLPPCFSDESTTATADPASLAIVRVTIGPGAGPGIHILPGSVARIVASSVSGRERGGMLVWGGVATVADSRFTANVATGIEFRSYPEGSAGESARGLVERTLVAGTAPVDGWIGGDGIVVADSAVALRDNRVTENAGVGVTIMNWQTFGGNLSGNIVTDNDGPGFCLDGLVAGFDGSDFRDNERLRTECASDQG